MADSASTGRVPSFTELFLKIEDYLAGPERRDADGQGVAVDEQVDGRGDAHEGVTEEGVGRNTCVIDVIIVIFFTPTHARTQSRDWRLKAGRNSTRWRRLTGLGAVRQLMGQLGRSLQAQRVVAEDQEVEQATGRREAGVDRQPSFNEDQKTSKPK